MPNTIDALAFLANAKKHPAQPVCVVFGDDSFLKRLTIQRLRNQVLGDDDGEFSFTRFDGREAGLTAVLDELSTRAMFGDGQRLVLVEDADNFVTQHRSRLEDYITRPKPGGVLLLEVSTWPKNTRLYKLVDANGLQIECKSPTESKLIKWLIGWSKSQHAATLQQEAAEALLELVGPELGLLDQELAKLAVSVPQGQPIGPDLVLELVGGWRAKTAWDLLDAAAAGQARAALVQLDRLILAGEHPIALLAQMSSTLRRFAAATRIIEQAEAAGRRPNLRQALEEAGVKTFVLAKSEEQLRRLGRQRAANLFRWLLEADLELKGASALKPRVVLERLIVRMAAQLQTRSTKH